MVHNKLISTSIILGLLAYPVACSANLTEEMQYFSENISPIDENLQIMLLDADRMLNTFDLRPIKPKGKKLIRLRNQVVRDALDYSESYSSNVILCQLNIILKMIRISDRTAIPSILKTGKLRYLLGDVLGYFVEELRAFELLRNISLAQKPFVLSEEETALYYSRLKALNDNDIFDRVFKHVYENFYTNPKYHPGPAIQLMQLIYQDKDLDWNIRKQSGQLWCKLRCG